MKKLLFVALAAVGMTACVQNEELAVPQSSATIAFTNFVGNATKADPSYNETTNLLPAFDVWGFMDETAGTVFTGEDVERVGTGNNWTYVNTQYWAPEHTYYFAALAPMNSTNVELTLAGGDAAKVGLGTVEFTNVAGTEDLLYAKAKVDPVSYSHLVNVGMDPVALSFQHLLAKVKFTFQNGFGSENYTVNVTEVTMKVKESATINLAEANYNWTGHAGELTLEFGDVPALVGGQGGAKAEAADERLTIPADANAEYEVTFKLEVLQGQLAAIPEVTKTATISGLELAMGKAYNFTAVISNETLALPAIEFTATVQDWDEPTIEKEVDYIVDPTTNSYVASNVNGLAQIAEEINAGTIDSDVTIALSGDIDLAALAASTFSRAEVKSNWVPVGTPEKPFTGTFDGKGYTIKNLTLVEAEAKEGKAHIGFISYAKDATIKNVTFENVYINIPCLDIDHSQGHIGAVVGTLEGTSVVENVTVKGDVKVEATPTANGASRVAAVVGGNSYANVTIKNVHVIANAGSYVKANNNTGAIAGQLQGKTVYENCSSNIDVTVNKFFAGGIVGLAGTNDTFTNCHTTGNIAVVAGREGRHNDEYRVGGIAGGWSDGKNNVCTLVNCSYTGTVSGVNADGAVAEPLDYMGYVGRGYTLANCAGSKVIINGTEFIQAYNNVYGVYYYEGAILDINGVKALVYSVANGSVKAVSVEELNLNGKTWQNAMDWAAGLGEGWALASMEDLNAIYDLRVALNKALVADNAENALFWEGDELYVKNGSVYYANYMSSTEVPNGADANGNKYFSNRVFFKQFNDKGYSDVLYSAFDCINKYAPLRDNYFARATVTL